jgi:proteic killer suppression protein
MIRTFRDKDAEELFNDNSIPRFRNIERAARRKLLYLNAAKTLEDLRVPPGNRLEALKGDRGGQHSIRINDQWRICFTWNDGEALKVEIVDYH